MPPMNDPRSATASSCSPTSNSNSSDRNYILPVAPGPLKFPNFNMTSNLPSTSSKSSSIQFVLRFLRPTKTPLTPEMAAEANAAAKIIGFDCIAKIPAEFIVHDFLVHLAKVDEQTRNELVETVRTLQSDPHSEPSTSNSTQLYDGGRAGVGGSLMATMTSRSPMEMNPSTSDSSVVTTTMAMAATATTSTLPKRKSSESLPTSPKKQNMNSLLNNHFMSSADGSPALFNLDFLAQQSDSPGSNLRVAKNEPRSTSSSNPGTPLSTERRSVPACAICGTDSTGIHFGVDACAACSAFFRRTVVLEKQYVCNKNGNCQIDKSMAKKKGGAVKAEKCRSCRFKKCLVSGMDKNSVQHRRDAIGKYSAGVKRTVSSDVDFEQQQQPQKAPIASPTAYTSFKSCEPSSSSNGAAPAYPPPAAPPQPPVTQSFNHRNTSQFQASTSALLFNTPSPCSKSVLHELILLQNFLCEQRHLFYSDRNLNDWFRKPFEVEKERLQELTSFTNCMYHLWKVEPRLAADFISRNRFLDRISMEDKLIIYKNFVVVRQAVEEPYLTYKNGGLENNWFVMPNRTYIDFSDPEKYFRNGALNDLKLDLATTKNLFLPSFRGAMQSVGVLMRDMRITETEIVILLGLVLLDPGVCGLTEITRHLLLGIRDQLIQDTYNYYEDEEPTFDPEIRMADLFMIMAAIKIHAIKTSENMHLLKFFDLIPSDPCFNQILEREDATFADFDGLQNFGNNGQLPGTSNESLEKPASSNEMMNGTSKVQVLIVNQANLAPADYQGSSPSTEGSERDVIVNN